MKYLRAAIRDRLNAKFNPPRTAPITASLSTPTFTRRVDGTYVLVVDVSLGVATHKWLDELGCKADRIVGRDKTTFVFHVITDVAIARIGKKHGVRDEYVPVPVVTASVVEVTDAIEVVATVVEVIALVVETPTDAPAPIAKKRRASTKKAKAVA